MDTTGGDGKLFMPAVEGPGSTSFCCLRDLVTLPPARGSAGGTAGSAAGSGFATALVAAFLPGAAFLGLGAGALSSDSFLMVLKKVRASDFLLCKDPSR